MAFNLAGFAEGLHPALQDLAAKVHQGQIAKIQLNNLIGQAGQADPNQNGPPAPQGGPPQAAPMPGATPMPSAAPAPPGGPGGVSPMMSPRQATEALANPSATQPPSVGAIPQAPVGPGTGPPAGAPSPSVPGGGASAPVMSGTAQPTGNEFQDSQKTLRSILMDLKQRNPRARPADILAAADQQIQMMKGLNPDTAALLRAQTASLAIDQRYSAEYQKAQTAVEALQIGLQKQQEKLDAMQHIADEVAQTKKDIEEMRGQAARDVAGIQGRSREAAAATGAGARRDVAGIQGQTARDVAATGAQSRRDVANTGARARVYGAQAGAAARSFKEAPPPPRFEGPRGEDVSPTPSAPPVKGARKAPDGNWYVSDPKRPGKYLQVQIPGK